ncbi:MAG: altronate dehydratase family protein [Eubacteriales bacterium]|nr:altronate dehydratase family protein [Eubacteriales bacterium]
MEKRWEAEVKIIQIHPSDNVAVALTTLRQGEEVQIGERRIRAAQNIERGHKMALQRIAAGEVIVKYGNPIAGAVQDIGAGEWVHTHNARTRLSEESSFSYHHKTYPLPAVRARSFQGYRREDGRAAIRNELWILPTVGCVNAIAKQLAETNQSLVGGSVEGLYAFSHPFGCSQMGDDHARTRKLLAALARHPNAGGVLVLGLGCENLTMEQFKEELGEWNDKRVKFLVCQEVEDEIGAGTELLRELARYAGGFRREEIPAGELVVGMKCGGSDGLSGITANPAVGRFSDRLIALGGTTVLTEVPEMFGAENILLERCADGQVFDKAVAMVENFKAYFTAHGQVVYENPSPGNKAGGITTLEDKSCGCVQKGGSAQVVDVLDYAEPVTRKGLNLLSGPGNDLVSATDLTAAGAHLILFTTGRGTPFGAPAPTVKISTNTALFEKKKTWMDFNAGTVAEGEPLDETAERLLDFVLEVAGGVRTRAEQNGCREISIFKDGVVL